MKQKGSKKISRPTIGFLIDLFYDQYQMEIWSGVYKAAESENINLVCFCGGAFNSPYENEARTKAYELIQVKDFDGLIILSSTIGNFTSRRELNEFCHSFTELPTLSIGTVIPDMPSIVVESDQSMFELIAHCIREHACRKIAFIKGTDDNDDAVNRFITYKKTLEHFGIPFDNRLVVPGDFCYGSGRRAVTVLLDERKLIPDAIIGANDITAIDLIESLRERGIHIPQQIMILGFDNTELGRKIKPALTTISQPVFSLGYRSMELMKRLLSGETVPEVTRVPTYLKIRQSCGCKITKLANHVTNVYADVNRCKDRPQPFKEDLFNKIKRKLEPLCKGSAEKHLAFHYANTLYTIFYIALKYKQPQIFLENLENLICEKREYNFSLEEWRKVVGDIFKIFFFAITNEEDRRTLQCLQIHFAELIRGIQKGENSISGLNMERIASELHRFSQELIITFNLEKLKRKIKEVTAKLDIRKIFITCSINEGKNTALVTPILAHDIQNPQHTGFPVLPFPRSSLIAECLKAARGRITYIVMPLLLENELLGFSVFEPSVLRGIVYEHLTVQLSSALKSAFIIDQLQKSLDEKEVLLQEIHHRVKNNLQIILSLMNFQPGGALPKNRRENFNAIKGRIQTIALIHEELMNAKDLSIINFKNYVNTLADRIVFTYAKGRQIDVDIDMEDIFLNIQTATPCGLVINEILTNSIRHAFSRDKNNEHHKNKISIRIRHMEDKKMLEMIIGDNGIGLPGDFDLSNGRTMGLQLVDMLVCNQLGGKLAITGENGTLYKIECNNVN